MGIYEQLRQEAIDHDPHGLKFKGDNAPRHAFPTEPYVYKEFPQILTKDGYSVSVNSQEELDQAKADGFSAEIADQVSNVTGSPLIQPTHVVIEEKGTLVPAQTPLTEEQTPAPAVEEYSKSSGIDGDSGDWTLHGDGTNYPNQPSGQDIEDGRHGDVILPPADERNEQV